MILSIFAKAKRPKELSEEEASIQVDKWINIKNATEKEVIIDIDGEIGDDFWGEGTNTVKAIKKKLKDIAALKTKKIIVNINSLGGSVAHGLGIHDILAQHKAEIETNVQGLTASSATIIAQAGDVRKMSDNALYLIHQPWGLFMSNVTELEQDLEDIKSINARMVNIYVKRSGQTEDEIRSLMDEANGNGKWIDADEAIDMGLIDEVYEPMKAAAMVLPLNVMYHMKLPELPKAKEPTENNNTQILDIMKKELKETLDSLKVWFADTFKKEGTEEVTIPEDAQKKLDELEAQITEVGNQEDRITELEGQTTSIEKERDEANSGLETAKASIKTLESDLAKAKGHSTNIDGTPGLEDSDNPASKVSQMLAKDLATIKDRLI